MVIQEGSIIMSDLTSDRSYTIIGLEDGILMVSNNVNSRDPQEYKGKCPPGSYLKLADIKGLDFSKLTEKIGVYETEIIKVDENGFYIIEQIPPPSEVLNK